MFVRSTSLVAVDANASCVKALELRENGGKLSLGAATVRPVPTGAHPSAVLQGFLKGTGVKERRAAVVLPQGATWVQRVDGVHAGNPVAMGIELATRDLPFSAEELCGAVSLEANGQHRVAVVPRAALDAALECVDAAGLRPTFVVARSQALAAVVAGPQRSLVVEITASGTEFVVVQGGRVCGDRHHSIGLDDLARAGVVAEIAAEAELMLAAMGSDESGVVERVLLAGEGATVPSVAEQLAATLKLPVEVLDPCAGFACDGTSAALDAKDRAALAAALGVAKLALVRVAGVPDLLPESRRAVRRWSPKTAAACALVTLVFAASAAAWFQFGFGSLDAATTRRQQLLTAVKSRETRLLHLAGLRAEKSDIDDRGRIIREIATSRVPWTRKLDELWQVTSESDASGASMWLNSLSVKVPEARAAAGRKAVGETVSLQGWCLAERKGDPLQRFNTFHERLKTSAFFTGSFENINNPAGKAVELSDGRPAWIVALDMQMASRVPEKVSKPTVAKAGG